MAIATQSYLGENRHIDSDLDAAVETIPGVTEKLYAIEVDNTQNAEAVYVKIYDAAASPTVGSDDPKWCFKVEGGDIRIIGFTGDPPGPQVTASQNFYLACVTEPGTAGTTSPTNDVKMTLLTETPA